MATLREESKERAACQTESAVEEGRGCYGGARSAEQRKRWRVQNRVEQGGRSCTGARVAPAEKFGL